MTRRPVVRGNPQIDKDTLDLAVELTASVKSFTRVLRITQKNLDSDTVSKVTEQLHKMDSDMSACKAILEKLRRIRAQQSTALVGGSRRKR